MADVAVEDSSMPALGGMSDAELVDATRNGDRKSYGELWRRHYPAALVAARATTMKFDADDLAQEAFAAIFVAIQRGSGPRTAFRAYLLTAVRHTAAKWGRKQREFSDDQFDTLIDPDAVSAPTDEALDRSLTNVAFKSLPTRWQEVLWYTEVEQMKPAAVAPLLGLQPNAVTQLAFRAREGLREAWIQAHLRSLSDDSECHWVVARLGAHTRNNTSRRDVNRIRMHLVDCGRCGVVAAEASSVGSRLALVLLPLALGVAGGSSYLSWIQSGGSASTPMAMGAGGAASSAIVLTPAAPSSPSSAAATVSGTSASGASAGAALTVSAMKVAVSALAVVGLAGGAVVSAATLNRSTTTSDAAAPASAKSHDNVTAQTPQTKKPTAVPKPQAEVVAPVEAPSAETAQPQIGERILRSQESAPPKNETPAEPNAPEEAPPAPEEAPPAPEEAPPAPEEAPPAPEEAPPAPEDIPPAPEEPAVVGVVPTVKATAGYIQGDVISSTLLISAAPGQVLQIVVDGVVVETSTTDQAGEAVFTITPTRAQLLANVEVQVRDATDASLAVTLRMASLVAGGVLPGWPTGGEESAMLP